MNERIEHKTIYINSKKANKRIKKTIAEALLMPLVISTLPDEGKFKTVEEKNPKLKVVKRKPFQGGLPELGKKR